MSVVDVVRDAPQVLAFAFGLGVLVGSVPAAVIAYRIGGHRAIEEAGGQMADALAREYSKRAPGKAVKTRLR